MSQYELSVHTVDSVWTRKAHQESGEQDIPPRCLPYQRIVGLPNPDGDMLWDGSSRGDPEGVFDPDDTTVEHIPMTDVMHERLAEFYAKHLVDPRANPRGYNCHYFAVSITRGDEPHKYLPDIANVANRLYFASLKLQSPETRIALGDHAMYGGYVAALPDEHMMPIAAHSIIGLGEECPRNLQVVAWGGHLGLSNYNDLLVTQRSDTENIADYCYPGRGPLTDYGLYAARGSS